MRWPQGTSARARTETSRSACRTRDINTDLGLFEDFDIGKVIVLFGATGGLSGEGEQSFTSGDVPQTRGGRSGATLSAWNYGRGAEADLAVGTPSNDDDRGIVNVLSGSSTGLNFGGS